MGPTDGRNADKRLCDICSARRLSPVAPTTNSVALSVHNQRNSVHTTKIEDHIGPKELGREYVLDLCPPPLTLAQKLGLVEAPRALLTEQQWGQVKAASNARQDSCLPCPICKEQFGMREQVSLSLSCLPHGIFGLFFVVNRYPLCFSTIHDLTQPRPHSVTTPLSPFSSTAGTPLLFPCLPSGMSGFSRAILTSQMLSTLPYRGIPNSCYL